MGESDVFLNDGEHHYEIIYQAENAIGFHSGFDELYWNVNGFDWAFQFPEISAKITFPDGANVIRSSCYTGSYGSRSSACNITQEENSVLFAAENLSSGENLTIAAAIPKGFLNQPPPPPPPPPPTWFEKFGLLLVSLLLMIILIPYYIFTWRKHGVDPPKPTPFPQFEAPQNLSPASVGMLHKEHYWNDLVTTSIVNLAIKGFLQIKEDKKSAFFGLIKSTEFTLIKLKDEFTGLPKEEKVLMEELFSGSRNEVVLDGEYKVYIKDTIESYKSSLTKQHKKLLNEGNNYNFLILPALLIVGFIIFALVFGIITGSTEVFQFLFGGISALTLLIFGIAFSKAIFRMHTKWFLIIGGAALLILFLILLLRTQNITHNYNGISAVGFIVFGLISLALYQYYIKRPSEDKLHIKSLIEGFKMYLGAAEEKPLQHFNPPQMTPEIFEKYLPYAIALETDEVWGDKFQNFLNRSALEPSNYQHNWYSGTHLNFAGFGHALNTNLSNSISTASTPPSSSGSGSGGGGFSGGGGGGGGGGGW